MILDLNECFPVPLNKGVKRGPLPKQAQFLSTVLDPKGSKYVAYFGGVGSGKSMILCIAMLAQAVMHGGEFVIARQFMPELRRTTYKNFLEICPPKLIKQHRIADCEVHLHSASGKPAIIYFVGLDEPDKLRSLNLSGFGIDEASQVSEEAFLLLMNRLRNPQGLRKGIIVGNPAGHNWVFHRFVKQDIFATEQAKSEYKLILAPSTENVHLPDGYVESMLQNYSAERIQREIMGSFDAFEGAVYPEFRRDVHVIKPFKIPENWTRVAGVDHGYRNPAAWVWGAVDGDQNIYIYREFYEREWLIEEICAKGKPGRPSVAQLMRSEKLEQARIDPSTRAARTEKNGRKVSDYDLYLEHLPAGFPLLLANNEVTAGIDRTKSYLKVNENTGKPKLFIFETCSNLIDELCKYRYKELRASQEMNSNEKEEPVKKDDHAVDALRYLIMSQPEPFIEESNPYEKINFNSLEGAMYRDLKELKQPKDNKDPFGM